VCLIQVMSADLGAEGVSDERRQKMDEMRRVDKPPNPEQDFARFAKWYDDRDGLREREIGEILERAPQQDWAGLSKETDEAQEEAPPAVDDSEPPLTRSQEVCKQILNQSIYFLSHSSPFLRSRVLALIAAAVPVLAGGNREGDLLPLIDRAWGIIIIRLSDAEGYVATAAAEVIAALAEHTGDYMGRRILDHAWPKFKSLLAAQQAKDQHSALVRNTARVGGPSSHTTSHRLHIAILNAMKWVAAEVPVDDSVVWGMAVAFRPFLDRRAHEAVQDLAKRVYAGLVARDGDLVWVVLRNTVNADRGGVWGYLREPGLDVKDNVELILVD
jgi:hypothetical protein